MTDDTIKTLAWAVVMLAAIQAGAIYCVVRLAITGRSLFERHEHDGGKIIGRFP